MDYHRGRYIQRGRGFGSILSSFFRTVLPVVKSIGSSIIKSPITKQVLSTARNSAIDAGLNIAADALSGENVGDSLQKHAGTVAQNIAQTVRDPILKRPAAAKTSKRKAKRKPDAPKTKRRKPRRSADFYDEYQK
jgi:hypothetical protein